MAGTFTLLRERITDSSVDGRLRACKPWVKALLHQMLPTHLPTTLPDGLRFVVVDGSCIQGPGARGTDYRLHVCMDLASLEFIEVRITDKHTGESLKDLPLGPGDVVVGDRGYCHAWAMGAAVRQGVQVMVRLNPHNMPLYHGDGSAPSGGVGTRVDWLQALQDQTPGTVQTLPVLLSAPGTQPVKGFVHAFRLDPKGAAEARRACRQRNSKKGRTPKQTTLFLAEWVLVFTTLDPKLVSAETVLELYRVRWQVEQAIKRWKSLMDADQLRARAGSPLAEVWLHGKMLYALLVERRMRRQVGDRFGRLDVERTATWWRPYQMVQERMRGLITAAMFWQAQVWGICLEVLQERPRKRKLQQLPEGARALVQAYWANVGQSLGPSVAA